MAFTETSRSLQVSEFAEEDDLRSMFERFGRVTRVFLAKDRETGRAKGFAFISFQERSDAARACEKMDGCKSRHELVWPLGGRHADWIRVADGFGHLILKVEFAKRSQ